MSERKGLSSMYVTGFSKGAIAVEAMVRRAGIPCRIEQRGGEYHVVVRTDQVDEACKVAFGEK